MPEGRAVLLAEAVRFELTDLLQPTVFKTVAIDHSATLPRLVGGVLRPMLPVGRSLPPVTSHFDTVTCPKD